MAEAGVDAARRVLTAAIANRVFPAAVAEVGRCAGPIWREPFGKLTFDADAPPPTAETIFDLASLTKPLATTTLVLELMVREAMALDERLTDLFPEWRGIDRAEVTITDLLEHASGLPARLLDRPPSGRREFEHEICSMPLEYQPRTKSVYSDLDFILLGFLVSDRAGRSIREQFVQLAARLGAHAVDAARGMTRDVGILDFGPVPPANMTIAPTEPLDDDLRKGARLVGEVHDHYAALLGGAAGHAGLFGNVAGVGGCARATLKALRDVPGGEHHLPVDLIRRSVRRSDVPGSSRALGWDTMLATSSCGTKMSSAACGHVGFTGTSLWIDPANDRYFILLTNRVCGGGTLSQMRQVRRAFHDALAGA